MNLKLDDKKSLYKLTEVGEIPVDWEIKSMNDICSRIVVGIASSTSGYYTTKDNGIPIIRNQNIKENRLDLSEVLYITEEFDLLNKKKRLRIGDILTVRTGYPGVTAVVTDKQKDFQTFTTLISTPDEEKIDSDFLAYYMNSPVGKKFLTGMSAGGAQQNLNVSSLAKLKVIIPSFKEQKKITEILMIADEQIGKTEQLIEKTKELKKGLMGQLLIKGIDHANFKQTELGEIPIDWEVHQVKELANLITKGTSPSNVGFTFEDEGVNFIKVESLSKDNKILPSNFAKISDECHQKLSRSVLLENDLLISIAGTLGRTGIVKKEMVPANTNQALAIIRLKDKHSINFLYYFLQSNLIQKRIKDIATTGAQPNLSLKQIGDFKVALPPLKEQEKIVEIISSVDEQIEIYEKEKEKQVEMKKALMQQLLTGKIRVTV